jgi:hypothetical protein
MAHVLDLLASGKISAHVLPESPLLRAELLCLADCEQPPSIVRLRLKTATSICQRNPGRTRAARQIQADCCRQLQELLIQAELRYPHAALAELGRGAGQSSNEEEPPVPLVPPERHRSILNKPLLKE